MALLSGRVAATRRTFCPGHRKLQASGAGRFTFRVSALFEERRVQNATHETYRRKLSAKNRRRMKTRVLHYATGRDDKIVATYKEVTFIGKHVGWYVDAKDELKRALKEYKGSILMVCHEPEFYQDVVSQVWDCSKWTTKIL